MSAELGDPTGPGDNSKTLTAGSDLSAGDVVAIDQSSGDVELADSNNADRDQFAGVVRDDAATGEEVTIITSAPAGIVAVADSDGTLNGGDRVGIADSSLAGEEAGEFVTEDGGPVLLLSDEGGETTNGESLSSGEAEVAY